MGSRRSCLPRCPARRFTVAWLVTAFAVLLPAGVAGACTAVGVRFGDHPAYVRAVVGFSGGSITTRSVEAIDPHPFDGSAALRVTRTRIGTRVEAARRLGVTVRISARTGALQITLVAAPHRFKYLSYTVIGGNRLAIDLWKSAPPSKAAEIHRGPAGCLTLDESSVIIGRVSGSGRARGIFENQFPLVLRGSDGAVIAQRTMHVSGGWWSGQLTYHASRAQTGTLEAVETSAKDGALICIVQIRVTIRPSPAVAVKVLSKYPQGCLRAVRRPTGAGRVAMLQGNKLTIASPTGGTPIVPSYNPPALGSFQGGVPLVGWSRDGRYVATRFGSVWTAAGAPAGKLFATPAIGSWTWSPASDCALAVTATSRAGTTIAVGEPGHSSHAYLSGHIAAFAFSPNGRTLYMAVGQAPNDARFAMLDLATGRLRDIGPTHGNACCVSFGGFAPGGKVLLFWAGQGASVDSDGVNLQGLDTANNNRIVTYGTKGSPVFTMPGAHSVVACGADVLAVVGVGRIQETVADKRLAIVFVGKPPMFLTPKTVAYLSPSCSGDGFTAAAVQYTNGGKLSGPATLTTIIVKDGTTSQPAPNAGLLDSSPEWGRTGDLLYGRTPPGSSTAQLWYASGGNPPHDTGLRASDTGLTALSWDWSITPPRGIG
ncbi:MAG: Gmad2 immunoglobulin-like domain-containing protein [Solirubrobacteraceae bacterium]